MIGSDNGFVQAWELSLDGEYGVGGQPLWSQKVRWDRYTSWTHVCFPAFEFVVQLIMVSV